MVGSVLSGIKISANLAATGNSNATLYTVPANSVAIFQIGFASPDGNESCRITIDGTTIAAFSGALANGIVPKYHTAATTATTSASSGAMAGPFFAGPGAVIAIASQTGSPDVSITGVVLVNTP